MMKTCRKYCITQISMVTCFLTTISTHGVPKEPVVASYDHIIVKNPFQLLVIKKTINKATPVQKKVTKFVLKGVTELSTGWLVVIAAKANPKQSIILNSSDTENPQYQVLEVSADKLDYRKTEVKLLIDKEEHIVTYNSSNFIQASKAVTGQKKPAKISSKTSDKRENKPLNLEDPIESLDLPEPEVESDATTGNQEQAIDPESESTKRTRPQFKQPE